MFYGGARGGGIVSSKGMSARGGCARIELNVVFARDMALAYKGIQRRFPAEMAAAP